MKKIIVVLICFLGLQASAQITIKPGELFLLDDPEAGQSITGTLIQPGQKPVPEVAEVQELRYAEYVETPDGSALLLRPPSCRPRCSRRRSSAISCWSSSDACANRHGGPAIWPAHGYPRIETIPMWREAISPLCSAMQL